MAENIPTRPRRTRVPAIVEDPDPPAGLSESSRELWRQITREWVLDVAALSILTMGLEQRDTYDQATEQLRREGLILYNTKTGVARPHPAAAIAREALGAYRLALRHLGLEPEGR